MDQVGIRALRANLAAAVRQAQAGERVLVTIDGRPVAQLGPIQAPASPGLAELAASGLIEPPRRPDVPADLEPVDAPVDVRIDRVVDEVRGG